MELVLGAPTPCPCHMRRAGEGFLHVVDEWQRHLVHVGALVRQEAAPLETRRSGTTRIHDWPGGRVASQGGGKCLFTRDTTIKPGPSPGNGAQLETSLSRLTRNLDT